MRSVDPALATEDYAYLTTRGRVTGNPHEIEIWFALVSAEGKDTLYMMAGNPESDWVRNARQTPAVTVRLAATTFRGTARILDPATEEDARARRLLLAKYATPTDPHEEWGRTGLPVAVDLEKSK